MEDNKELQLFVPLEIKNKSGKGKIVDTSLLTSLLNGIWLRRKNEKNLVKNNQIKPVDNQSNNSSTNGAQFVNYNLYSDNPFNYINYMHSYREYRP